MEKEALIEMLNRDMAEEHAAIIRYLVHSYLEGEDSPLGASLLSRSREEMWHMHWLGMIVGKLGGEPNMTPSTYPFDPTNRKTIFQSYVKYEEQLVPHYHSEAEKVEDPHIKRVLHREAWESEVHARRFERILKKLTPEQAEGLPGEANALPAGFVDTLQASTQKNYLAALQHVRDAWVFQGEGTRGWEIMDYAMTKMKQLAHVAEEVSENGIEPSLNPVAVDTEKSLSTALVKALENMMTSLEHHRRLRAEGETGKHGGLVINLDLTVQQEAYQIDEIQEWLKKGS
jgi:bacterioferritin